MDREEVADALLEAKEAIEEALEEARTALRACEDGFLYEQADAYWLSQIEEALGGHMAMVSMQDTIDALDNPEED